MSGNRRPARVLYTDTAVGLAGGQFALLEILKFIDRSRVVPLVASPSDSALRSLCKEYGIPWLELGVTSAHIPASGRRWPRTIKDPVSSIGGTFDLAAKMRKHKVDILHANTFKAALVGGIAANFIEPRAADVDLEGAQLVDGKVHYAMSDISLERRENYAWYGYWPAELLATDYSNWQKKWSPEKNVLRN